MKAAEMLESPFLHSCNGLKVFKVGGLDGISGDPGFRHESFFRYVRDEEQYYKSAENRRRESSRKGNNRHYGIVLKKRYEKILDRRKNKTRDLYNEMFAICERKTDVKVLDSLFQVLKAVEDYATDYTDKKKHVTLTKDYVFVAPVSEIDKRVRKGRWMTNTYMRLLTLLGMITRVSHEEWGRDPYVGQLGIREQHYRLETIKIKEIVRRWQTWIDHKGKISELDHDTAFTIFGAKRVNATYHTPESVIPLDENGDLIMDSEEAMIRKANLKLLENPDYWQNNVWTGQKGKCRALIRLAFSRLEEAKKYLKEHVSWYNYATHQRFEIPCNERVGIIRVYRNRIRLNLDEILNMFKMLTIARRCIVNNWAESVFAGICKSESWWNNESHQDNFKTDLPDLYHKMTLVAPELFRHRPRSCENYGDIRHDVFGTVVPKEDSATFPPFYAPLRRYELDSYTSSGGSQKTLRRNKESEKERKEREKMERRAEAERFAARIKEVMTMFKDYEMSDEEYQEKLKIFRNSQTGESAPSDNSIHDIPVQEDNLVEEIPGLAEEIAYLEEKSAQTSVILEQLKREREQKPKTGTSEIADILRSGFAMISEQFKGLNQKLDNINNRLGSMNQTLTSIDQKIKGSGKPEPPKPLSIAEGISSIVKKHKDRWLEESDEFQGSFADPKFQNLYNITLVDLVQCAKELPEPEYKEFERILEILDFYDKRSNGFARDCIRSLMEEPGCTLGRAYLECVFLCNEMSFGCDVDDPIFKIDVEKYDPSQR